MNRRTLLFGKILIILAALPVVSIPALISVAPDREDVKMFICIYPIYVILSTVCEWLCLTRKRQEITWILLILMLLTHVAMWVLVQQ